MTRQQGFSLLEAMLALVILAAAVIASSTVINTAAKAHFAITEQQKIARLASSHLARLEWQPVSIGASKGNYDANLRWQLDIQEQLTTRTNQTNERNSQHQLLSVNLLVTSQSSGRRHPFHTLIWHTEPETHDAK